MGIGCVGEAAFVPSFGLAVMNEETGLIIAHQWGGMAAIVLGILVGCQHAACAFSLHECGIDVQPCQDRLTKLGQTAPLR